MGLRGGRLGESTRARLRRTAGALLVGAMLGLGILGVLAPAADARPAAVGNPLGLVGTTGLPGTTAPNLGAVFDSPNLGNVLAAVGCPLAKALPSPPVPDQIQSVLCALGVLDYAYRTTYIEPNGTKLVRITRALLGVPTPISVTGGLAPEFLGTIGPDGLDLGLGLTIARLPSIPAGARVSIEAVVLDPAAPSTYVGIGEDGLAAGTDASWSTDVTLLSDTTAATELGVTQTNHGAPSSVGVLGEVFSGPSPDSPTDISRGDVSFTPVPASLTTDITLGAAGENAAVTSTQPSRVDAALNLISPGDEKDIDATFDQLPKSVDIDYTQPNGHTHVTYTADAPIGQLSAVYHDYVDGAVATAAGLDATGVPTGLTFDQLGPQTAITTSGGPIGLIEARYGSDTDLPPSPGGTGAYLAYDNTPTGSTAGVRLPNLEALTLNAADPYTVDLTLAAPLSNVALSSADEPSGITVTGSLSNLPQHTTIAYETATGTVSFDGHGTGIDEIALDAVKAGGTFFGRASRVDATIDGIPAADTISFGQADGGVTASASAPIGSISLLASDGSDAPNVSGSYAWYVDTPATYQAFVRLSGLSGVSLRGDPFSGSIDAAAQVVKLHAQTSSGTFDSTIDQLPAEVDFSLTPGAGGSEAIDYDASAPIDQITLDATGLSLPLDGATNLHAEIDDLPSQMTLTLPAAGGTITFDPYGDHIGRLLVQVYGSAGPAGETAGHQALIYNVPNDQITVDLDKIGALSATETASPLALQYDIASAPLDFSVVGPLGDNNVGDMIEGTISNPEPATIDVSRADGNIMLDYDVNPDSSNFTGDGAIDEISLDGNTPDSYLDAQIYSIPANLHVCVQSKSDDTTCEPDWIPATVPTGGDAGAPVHDASFAIQVAPSALDGGPAPSPVTLDGVFCPQENTADRCVNGSSGDPDPEKVTIQDLSVAGLQAAFQQQTNNCSLSFSCGEGWLAFDTSGYDSGPITGDVQYFPDGDSTPLAEFNATDGSSLSADDWFYWFDYDVGATFTPVATSETGSLECIGQPHLQLNVADLGIDLLSGDLGLCP